MSFTPKSWQDSPSTSTPINAAALEDLETRTTHYVEEASISLGQLPSSVVSDSRGSAAGDLLLFNGTSFVRLAKGGAGEDIVVRSDGSVKYTPPVEIRAAAWGVKADGATDDTTALKEAVAVAQAGQVVVLPFGICRTSKPIVIPPCVTLRGTHGTRIAYSGASAGELGEAVQNQSMIKPLSTFSGGEGVILFLDKEQGTYEHESGGQRLENLTIDGSALKEGETIDAVHATGKVRDVFLTRVCAQFMPHNGFTTAVFKRAGGEEVHPFSWYMEYCMANTCGNNGYSHVAFTDTTHYSCEAINNGAQGFSDSACANSHYTNCRSEFNTRNGYFFTGGATAGGWTLTGCSTDRNGENGIALKEMTGNGPIELTGSMLRRDGRNKNEGGNNYAGLLVESVTCPVIVNGLTVYPGIDDNETGVNSPQNGVLIKKASNFTIDNANLHAASQGLKNEGENGLVKIGTNVSCFAGLRTEPSEQAAGETNLVKTATTEATSSTALVNDAQLKTKVQPNSTYLLDLVVFYDGAEAGDIGYGFTGPAGAGLDWGSTALAASDTGISGNVQIAAFAAITSTNTSGAIGTGTKTMIRIQGVLTTGATGGEFAFRWAQGTSSATATRVFGGSTLKLRQIA